MAYNYPYGNGQQLNLDWFLNEWKNLLAAWEAEKNGIEGSLQAEIDRAEAALADVFAARDAAAQSAANALESKNAAAQSASDASGYLATVRADANTASNAAQNAAQSESNAAESAQTALASKNTAANSERNAAQSEANANSSKNAAAQSAADALAHKDAAAQSAADALANKNAAAQSAEDASDAAASVEASAQQITNNTNDIANLKASIIQYRTEVNDTDPTQFIYIGRDIDTGIVEAEAEMYCPNLSTSSNENIGFLYGITNEDGTNENIIIDQTTFHITKNTVQWILVKFNIKLYKNCIITKTNLYYPNGKQEKEYFVTHANTIKNINTIGCYTFSGVTETKNFYWWCNMKKLPILANITGENNPPIETLPLVAISNANTNALTALALENM